MKLLELKFKNFKSYGNKEVIIDFENDLNKSLILLSAPNGYGKSTIKDAIEFTLYGRLEGNKLSDIPNRTNKNLQSYIKFESKNRIIEIQRNLTPNLFKLLINSKNYDKAGKRDIQEYIEDELFDIPYHVFKNTISLSINNFKSFLTINTKDKKEIIDKIFGFDIINLMNEESKVDRKDLESKISNISYEIDSINASIFQLQNKIEELKTKNKLDSELKIKSIINEINENKDKLKLVLSNISEYNIIKEKLDKALNSLNNKNISEKNKIRDIERKKHLYDNNKCPECGSDLTTDEHINNKVNYENEIEKLKKSIIETNNKIIEINNKVKNFNLKYDELLNNRYSIESDIKSLDNNLTILKREINNSDDILVIEDMVKSYKEELAIKKEIKLNFDDDFKFYKDIENILSANGVKKIIMDNILPLLNRNISLSLKDLDSNFKVKIDNNFECIVKSIGEEINVNTLSKGEKTRIDFGIIISLIKIIKLQYPNLNILFIDELFSNVDIISIDKMIELLKNISEKLNMNIFVVSHIPVSESLFDKKIILNKINTFSELKLQNLS
jgi:DNA repair exonuclease SbcCD ATPase subunit